MYNQSVSIARCARLPRTAADKAALAAALAPAIAAAEEALVRASAEAYRAAAALAGALAGCGLMDPGVVAAAREGTPADAAATPGVNVAGAVAAEATMANTAGVNVAGVVAADATMANTAGVNVAGAAVAGVNATTAVAARAATAGVDAATVVAAGAVAVGAVAVGADRADPAAATDLVEAALARAEEALAGVVVARSAEDAPAGRPWVTRETYEALVTVIEGVADAQAALADPDARGAAKAAARRTLSRAAGALDKAAAGFTAVRDANGPGDRAFTPADKGALYAAIAAARAAIGDVTVAGAAGAEGSGRVSQGDLDALYGEIAVVWDVAEDAYAAQDDVDRAAAGLADAVAGFKGTRQGAAATRAA